MKASLSQFSRSLVAVAITLLFSTNGAAFATVGASHGPMVRLRHGTSSNWSGYAAYGSNGSFSRVSASWVQPSLSCASQDTYSSYWVGLDGYNNSTVEQLGTEGDCSGGSPTFYAWYEMYPHPGYYINSIIVHAGDQFSASVAYGGGSYTLSLSDVTTGKSFTTRQKLPSGKRASAEVILEAPWNGGTLPLANFGTTSFTDALANGSPLGSYTNLDPITMLNPAGMKATPSPFDTSNKDFSVTYSAN